MTDGNRLAFLPDRGVVEVEGNDAQDFLQGLLTNDMDQAQIGKAIYSGLLTPQGKIQFDFLVFNPAPNCYWLDCPRESAADLAARLSLYRMRAKVGVADRSAELQVGVAPANSPASAPGHAFADPRHPSLPQRFISAAAPAEPLAGGGSEALSAYHAARIALSVPEGGRDYLYGEAFPHEVCYDLLNGVDFEKGCYVGQEVVSRMHHRGVAKTRITGVSGSAALPERGAEITGGEYPVGYLGSSDGSLGIALIRLDRAEEAVRLGVPLRVGDNTLRLRRPPWADYEVPGAQSGS